jgi:hypothetical protein
LVDGYGGTIRVGDEYASCMTGQEGRAMLLGGRRVEPGSRCGTG